jgi:hypothetical protein
MKWGFLFSAAVATGLVFSSCKKNNNNADNATPGQPQLAVQIKASNTNTAVGQKSTANANILWTSGYAYPRKIVFEAKQNDLSVEFTSTADQQIDLMASIAASFGNFTLPAGVYDEVELKIDLDKKDHDPAMVLEGTFTNNTTTYPIRVEIDDFLELKTESENVTISNDSTYTAVTTIDLSTITSGITENMLLNAQLTNGTIVISPTSNMWMYHTILSNLGNRHHHCVFEHHHH